MTTTPLTPIQHEILDHAIQFTGGKIDCFPVNIKGGARKKVLESLFKRALISSNGSHWFVDAKGYEALGRKRPATAPLVGITGVDATEVAPRRTRENSKQASVLRMLQRPEGATVQQICQTTGWQPHTVRGAFAGAFKKKLGLRIVSDKAPGGDRVYRSA